MSKDRDKGGRKLFFSVPSSRNEKIRFIGVSGDGGDAPRLLLLPLIGVDWLVWNVRLPLFSSSALDADVGNGVSNNPMESLLEQGRVPPAVGTTENASIVLDSIPLDTRRTNIARTITGPVPSTPDETLMILSKILLTVSSFQGLFSQKLVVQHVGLWRW